MKREETYVGIDVAKDRVDVAVRPDGDMWSVDYDERGISEPVSCLQTAEPAAVLLEATGGLEVPLVSALAAAALPVVVVNPRQVATSQRPRAGLPRPMRWMLRCLPTSSRRCGRPCAHCGMRTRRSSTRLRRGATS